ncbi:hypothetical protein KIH23_04970 [Flavobacterium sp. CYK-55]|uniref:hypothetical protein n=1 Tax=Flavobacterium sp. CYK-55 TaxID=2835529 RepID=UPI001BCC511D|nr:hypothetical protein [Flavobacterium sp. CYK-55]MBS7786640.1 hypothetical protein [Flavobacterium sp. CYK-55]
MNKRTPHPEVSVTSGVSPFFRFIKNADKTFLLLTVLSLGFLGQYAEELQIVYANIRV